MNQAIVVPVSVGELLDKVTILRIKTEMIKDQTKLANIHKELQALVTTCADAKLDLHHPLVEELQTINRKLWKIEDDIRDKELAKEFDEVFVELARAVYRTNDERFRVKSALNKHFGSDFSEEKSYKDYE